MQDEVLDFWFGAPGSQAHGQVRDVWFRKDPDFDALVAGRFVALHAGALRGELAQWIDAPRSTLALIILLDQFARNMFRDSAQKLTKLGHERAALISRTSQGLVLIEKREFFRAVELLRSALNECRDGDA